jgi:hypothetical protein
MAPTAGRITVLRVAIRHAKHLALYILFLSLHHASAAVTKFSGLGTGTIVHILAEHGICTLRIFLYDIMMVVMIYPVEVRQLLGRLTLLQCIIFIR